MAGHRPDAEIERNAPEWSRESTGSTRSSYESVGEVFNGFTEEDVAESVARRKDDKAVTELTVSEMREIFIDSLLTDRAQTAIKSTIRGCIEKKIEPLETTINTHSHEIAILKEKIRQLEGTKVPVATDEINKRNNLIFTGVEGNNKEIRGKIYGIIEDLEIKLSGQINISKRGREALVEFSTYWDRRKTYSKRTKLKSKGHGGVFINEDLTEEQSSIFYLARVAKKQGLIKAAWTYNCITNISKMINETIHTKQVNTEDELKTLLPELIIPPRNNRNNQNQRNTESTSNNKKPPTNDSKNPKQAQHKKKSKIPEPARTEHPGEQGQSNKSESRITHNNIERSPRERSPEAQPREGSPSRVSGTSVDITRDRSSDMVLNTTWSTTSRHNTRDRSSGRVLNTTWNAPSLDNVNNKHGGTHTTNRRSVS